MNGKWELTVHTYMGDMRSLMDYHVEGTVLTGTGEDASNGTVAQIENGRFENGEFSYDLTIKTAVGEMTNHLSGKVEGIYDLEPLTELVECQRVAHCLIARRKPTLMDSESG